MTNAVDPEMVWLFAQTAAQAVLDPDGDPDTPRSELRLTATEAGLTAVLPLIEAALRAQIASEIEQGPSVLRTREWWAQWVRTSGECVTVLPNDAFDALAASLDEPAKAVPELIDLFNRPAPREG